MVCPDVVTTKRLLVRQRGHMDDNKKYASAQRRAAVLAATASTVLVIAACSGSPARSSADSTATGRPSNSIAQEDAYAHCLTTHGLTGVTVGSGGTMSIDNGSMQMTLNGNGGIPAQVESHMSLAMQSAVDACKSLAPAGPRPSGGARQQPYDLAQGLKYTQCLRAHGVPNMPDPNSEGVFNVGGTGINPQSPQFEQAQQDCQAQEPAQISINDGTKVAS